MGVLGFRLLEDRPQPEQNKRWVLVSPGDGGGCSFVLARAANDAQRAAVGNQTGGRVFLFLHTDDFSRDYDRFVAGGVKFVRGPTKEAYGTVGVFEDLYGNLWDLIEYSEGGVE